MPVPQGRDSDTQTGAIIGAAINVHRELGNGFAEAIYHEALIVVLEEAGIPYQAEVPFVVVFKGKQLRARYRADLVCFGQIVVELKAVEQLTSIDEAQLLNYLKASGLSRGLLLNFGRPRLECRRFVGPGWRDQIHPRPPTT